ncbi:hypothetical protein KJ855_01955 [Patescibacteria group bacterium]|nr:hypothetical protein [Patescibacteria group bacterium]
MDILFVISLVVYLILMFVLLIFNVMAIRHILKYRFKGDMSMSVLSGYMILVVILILATTVSLLALSVGSFAGGG